MNLESKLRYSESSFNFLQNSIIFCMCYPNGYMTGGSTPCKPWLPCQQLTRLKRLRILFSCFCPISSYLRGFLYLLVSCHPHNLSLCSWSKVTKENLTETHMLLVNNTTMQKLMSGIY